MNTNKLTSKEEQKTSMSKFKKLTVRFKNFMSLIISNRAAFVGLIIVMLIVIVAILNSIFGKLMLPYDPFTGDLSKSLQSPSSAHFFGTDEQGRDIFSRVIY
jgi:peptide/nickel transport system permease protein